MSSYHDNYNYYDYYHAQQQSAMSNTDLYTHLTAESPEISQPTNISIPLFLHQRKAVHKMTEIENTHTITNDDIELRTNVAIYADKVGAGKSLTIASLIAHNPQPSPKTNQILGSNHYTSIVQLRPQYTASSNLLIVPHSLINQWIKTLHMIKDLKFTAICKNAQLETINWEELRPVIIITNTIFKNLKIPENHIWNRLIIDEPQTMPLKGLPDASFTWLICATPRDILYPRRNYLRSVAQQINYNWENLTKMIVVKSEDSIVEASLNLPDYNEVYIQCKAPRLFAALGHANLPQEALVRLQANDIQGAIETLNINATSSDNIVDSLIQNYKDQVYNEQLEINRLQQLRNISTADRNQRIKIHQDKLNSIQSKINNIIERVASNQEKTCPICLDTVTMPRAVTGCCQNSFCFECMLMALSASHTKACPMCKKIGCDKTLHIETDNIDNMEIEEHIEVVQELKSKTNTLMDIISNIGPTSRYLVFSEFSNSFQRIQYKMEEKGITYAVLKGAVATQERIIRDYEQGKVQILLMNAQHFGAGLNLQMTTDMIIYHKFRDDTLKKQIIGRGQRVGRTSPLTVHYLAHEFEYN